MPLSTSDNAFLNTGSISSNVTGGTMRPESKFVIISADFDGSKDELIENRIRIRRKTMTGNLRFYHRCSKTFASVET